MSPIRRPMLHHLLLLLLGFSPIFFFFPICLLAGTSPADAPTAYDVLERYGFPRGILPQGVRSYLLTKDGGFDAYLGGYGDCEFAVAGGYRLRYKRRISGRLDEPSLAIRELKGVTVRVLFVWLPIREVVLGDGVLSFHVGPLSASFPVSNFSECPRCRCGFHCSSSSFAAAAASSDT